MKFRRSQLDAVASQRTEDLIAQRLLELRKSGFVVDLDDGQLRVTDKGGNTTRADKRPGELAFRSAEGRQLTYQYYPDGRVRGVVDGAGYGATFERDRRGVLIAIRESSGATHRFVRDDQDRLVALEGPDGTATQYDYTDDDLLVRVVDRNGFPRTFSYDEGGRLESVRDARGFETALEHAGEHISSISLPNGDRHSFEYDLAGLLRRTIVNGAEHARHSFHAASNAYQVRYHDGTFAVVVFDGSNRILEARNETAAVRFSYDDEGRLVEENTNGQIVRFLRNEVGAITGIISPDGGQIAFDRDRDQRLQRVRDWDGNVYRFEWNAAGGLERLTYPNGVRASIGSTPAGHMATLAFERPGAAESWAWDYDVCNRVVRTRGNENELTYSYDGEGRLVDVDGADAQTSERFRLDPAGNAAVFNGARASYNELNQLTALGRTQFSYDSLGNMVAVAGPQRSMRLRYNARGQLIESRTASGVARYQYDALGRRIRKESASTVTRYVWAGLQLLGEVVERNGRTSRRDYLIVPEQPAPLAIRTDGETYFLHAGRLGEVLLATDRSGRSRWKASYSAFGEARVTGDIEQPWRFAGQYADEESGLHYVLARYYDPAIGRFLSMDPLRVQYTSLNFYTYCDGDPVNRIDPTGQIGAILGGIIIGAAIGAVVGGLVGAGVEAYRENKAGQPLDGWKIADAAAEGVLIGALGGAVFGGVAAALPAAIGAVGIGAIAGGVSGGATYCAKVAFSPTQKWSWAAFGTSVALGAGIGAVTMGVGGWIAGRLAAGGTEAAEVAAEEGAEGAAQSGAPPQKGSVSDANFAQSKINAAEKFSPEGSAKYTNLAGRPIETVDDLAQAIRDGTIKPSEVPVDYVVRPDGTKLIMNTRTSVALDRAGVPKTEWHGVDRTGQPVPGADGTTFDDLADAQLKRNGLPPNGTSDMPQGKNK